MSKMAYPRRVGICLLLWLNDAAWTVRPVITFPLMQMLNVLYMIYCTVKFVFFMALIFVVLIMQLFYALGGAYFSPMEDAKKAAVALINQASFNYFGSDKG